MIAFVAPGSQYSGQSHSGESIRATARARTWGQARHLTPTDWFRAA